MLDSRRMARKEARTGYRDDDEYGYVATDVNEDGGGCKGDIQRWMRALAQPYPWAQNLDGREPGPQANKQQEPTVSERAIHPSMTWTLT